MNDHNLSLARQEFFQIVYEMERVNRNLDRMKTLFAQKDDDDHELVKDATQTFGLMAQMEMLEEKCIELALAVHKWRSRGKNQSQLDEVAREIAGVELMLKQALYLYSGHQPFQSVLKNARLVKRQRLRNLIDDRKSFFKENP